MCLFAQANLAGQNFAREERNQTPRVRFEALSVGIALALRERPGLEKVDMNWANLSEFEEMTRAHASNSRPKLKARIEYVRDKLLAQ